MSKRLDKIFQNNPKKTKLISFLVGCDPNPAASLEILKEISKYSSCVEIGYPTSEASAEGPIIKRAHDRVLDQKIGLPKIIQLAKDLRSSNKEVGICLMGYAANLYMYSIPNFAKDIADVVDAVLVVDLPHEVREEKELRNELGKNGISLIKLIAPTTDDKRMKEITNLSSGFLYSVNVRGITGVKKADLGEVTNMMTRIKKFTKTPICCGFGIKTPEDARIMTKSGCQGIVIGSTLVEAIEKNLKADKHNIAKKIGEICRKFSEVLN